MRSTNDINKLVANETKRNYYYYDTLIMRNDQA